MITQVGEKYPKGSAFTTDDGRVYTADGEYRREADETPGHDCRFDDTRVCPECCDHEEHDHGICMDCEKDITDELASDAYDHAKGLRQDRDVP